jgi:hypothetical protein
MTSMNKETHMNMIFELIRVSFVVLLAASFLAFISAVGGFGGVAMPVVAAAAAGGNVGCAWVIWASNRVIDFTGGE